MDLLRIAGSEANLNRMVSYPIRRGLIVEVKEEVNGGASRLWQDRPRRKVTCSTQRPRIFWIANKGTCQHQVELH